MTGTGLAAPDSNHTGLPLRTAFGIAIAGAVLGLAALLVKPSVVAPRWVGVWLLASSLALAANLVALERLNVMMSYEAWVEKGMPPRTPRWRPAPGPVTDHP